MRSLSGIVQITLLTSPYPEYTNKEGKRVVQRFSCKHDCYYCPKETMKNSEGKLVDAMPRSYLTSEPACLRAKRCGFDAVEQINDRLDAYFVNGHPLTKLEIIILGGTWSEYPEEYQIEFIRDIYYAVNVYRCSENRNIRYTLEDEQFYNESNINRIIGLTIETRPDSINEQELRRIRRYGCTRIQLGMQSIYDDVLKKINRGATHKDTINAVRMCKNVGLKVVLHVMPDLPGSSVELDRQMMNYLVDSPLLQPDELKIYPTATTDFTIIKKWFEKCIYKPYATTNLQDLIDIIIEYKCKVKPWTRLCRIIRDIPEFYIHGGNKMGNLRQIVQQQMKQTDKVCHCIRCSEVKDRTFLKEEVKLITRNYSASQGIEYFISYEIPSRNILIGFIRIRITDEYMFKELENSLLIRELHVYGSVIAQHKKGVNTGQHMGYGSKLLLEAEKLASLYNKTKISIISGIGVREFYAKRGYHLENGYMVKETWICDNTSIICQYITCLIIILFIFKVIIIN